MLQVQGELDAALEKMFVETEGKKSLDPPGFVREVLASDAEAEEFMKKWTEMGLPTDPTLMKMIVDGFEEGASKMEQGGDLSVETVAMKQ